MKYFLILLSVFVISCGYRKESEVFTTKDGKTYYAIWIWKNPFKVIECYAVPMNEMTERKKDSLNLEADYFIRKCEAYE